MFYVDHGGYLVGLGEPGTPINQFDYTDRDGDNVPFIEIECIVELFSNTNIAAYTPLQEYLRVAYGIEMS